ncbi:MAG: hypothetical protein HDS92_05245 [Bacteroidales bacterium]|nr:hypothetical protein [Bacteroidales bacterium]MBD5377799.1 hypothetical protein [Bacteroides sp.]
MESDRIHLKVLGISYSQTQTGAYALILAQVGGPVRIPVVIGAAEAQSIAMKMEGITTPRPMTHDLMNNFARAFGIGLKEVFIYKFEDGIFYSEMTFVDAEREVTIDARTSDAIAMSMRTGAPIYTTRDIMEETGFVMEEPDDDGSPAEDDDDVLTSDNDSTHLQMPRLESYSVEELEKTLAKLIEREEYEEAAKVSEILKRKKSEQ